jgi:hypothetical protein
MRSLYLFTSPSGHSALHVDTECDDDGKDQRVVLITRSVVDSHVEEWSTEAFESMLDRVESDLNGGVSE